MRRPLLTTTAAVPIMLGLVGSLATGTVSGIPGPLRPWLWTATALLAAAAITAEVARARSRPTADHGSDLSQAARELAMSVRTQWQREEEQRGIHDPVPLPIRWSPADRQLADHTANVRVLPVGAVDCDDVPVAGQFAQIADVYQQVPSGRLVILGEPGSGKTMLAVRLVLDLLATRAPEQPVPVIISMGSWHPPTAMRDESGIDSASPDATRRALRDWLADQLVRDHPGLAAGDGGGTSLAAALLDAQLILPILDGFDELPAGLQRPALQALNLTRMPLVITSRVRQYRAAVARAQVLGRAAVIELDGLCLDDLSNYLPRTTTRRIDSVAGSTGLWDEVLDRLHDDPDDPASHSLREVLRTPLMVFLARTIYSDSPDQRPADLLDAVRFPSRAAIEDQLLSAYLPAVYRRPSARRRSWTAGQVDPWFRHLARHLNQLGTRDLVWWQLAQPVHPTVRVMANALAIGLIVGIVDWITTTMIWWSGPPLDSVLFAFTVAAAVGLAVGLLPRGSAFSASHARRRLLARTIGRGFLGAFVGGYLAGFISGLARDSRPGWTDPTLGGALLSGLWSGLSQASVIGILIGLVTGLASDFQRPARTALRIRGRGRDVRRSILRGCLGGLACGLLSAFTGGLIAGIANGLPNGFDNGLENALNNWGELSVEIGLAGVVVGFILGLAFGLTAPLEVTATASSPSSLRADRARVLGQMLAIGILIGLLQGIGTATSEAGLVDGIIVGLGAAVQAGVLFGLCTSAWGQWLLLSRIWLPLTGRLPWATEAFLIDGYERGVLRQAGPVYQFRHARLQEYLTRAGEHHADPTVPTRQTVVPGQSVAEPDGYASSAPAP